MKTYNYNENFFQQLIDLGRQRPWVLLAGAVYLILAFFTLTNPRGFPFSSFNIRHAQLGLSLTSFALLVSLGIYLLYNNYRMIWGSSFLIYSISFLGLSLEAGWGFGFADMTDPLTVLFWRTPMIIFAAGMWIGLSSLFSDNHRINYIPAFFIFVIGESWFIIGMGLLNDIELTMYGFLYGAFIPMMLALAYLWYRYNKDIDFSSTSLVALGFLLVGVIYSVWTPWHNESLNDLYLIFFTLLNVAFVLIFRGFTNFTKEELQYGR